MLLAGTHTAIVAKCHDTSEAMIRKHYAASILDYTDEITRKTLPALGPALQPAASNVVTLEAVSLTRAGQFRDRRRPERAPRGGSADLFGGVVDEGVGGLRCLILRYLSFGSIFSRRTLLRLPVQLLVQRLAGIDVQRRARRRSR